jgi:hypothetical protein
MALKNEVFNLCNKLAQNGWRELILSVTNKQLDIKQPSAEKLKNALLAPINKIDREFPGFEDYALEENKGISPRKPASSLLYHSLASPNVLWEDKQKKQKLGYFPSLEEIELVENFVFGITSPSLSLLLSEAGNNEIGVVVFANQYRTAVDTPHQKHADIVFSRTGVSRVGTADLLYNKETRAFEALVKTDVHKIRVLPAKYNAYLSIKVKGDKAFLGNRMRNKQSGGAPLDGQLDFWLPIHKLFSGDECIRDRDLSVVLNAKFKNEKVKKIHKFIKNEFSLETGQASSNLESEPFVLQNNIAQLDGVRNLVIPQVHKKLVEEALLSGARATLRKPRLPLNGQPLIKNDNTLKLLFSSLEIRSREANLQIGNARPAPEYMHIRSEVVDGQQVNDLNLKSNIINELRSKVFNALHYVDFTGDGFVEVSTVGLPEINKKIIAYAIVAAPDFFPFVEQSEILNRTQELAGIWLTSPLTLSDTRISPNINSHPEFKEKNGLTMFDTITALITFQKVNRGATNFRDNSSENRVSYLTDGAAGIFAPGWDTGWDVNIFEGKAFRHLAAYGLGSPFPEDSKLCAALSSFWPAVAPDVSRSFWPTTLTILPLTDEEIGANSQKMGWDGEAGPQYDRSKRKVIYKKMDYVDYTLNAFNNKFNFHLLGNINADEYLNRVMSFFKLRKIDSEIEAVDTNRNRILNLVSFLKVGANDSDMKEANGVLTTKLSAPALKFLFIKPSSIRKDIGIDKIEMSAEDEIVYIIDSQGKIAKKTLSTEWILINEVIV